MRISDWSSDVCSSDLTDLRDPGIDVRACACAIDDGGVVLVDDDLLGAAEHPQRYVFQLRAEFLADHIAGGEDCDILEHRFAAIAEARRLAGRDLEPTAELVADERGQRLAFAVLGDNRSEEPPSELTSL